MEKATITENLRTNRQSRALHKYCEMVAHELQNQGQTLQDVIKKVDMVEITPTTHTIKEILWKPIMETVVGKNSTTKISTAEVNKVYEIMAMFLSKNFEISLPFPDRKSTRLNSSHSQI